MIYLHEKKIKKLALSFFYDILDMRLDISSNNQVNGVKNVKEREAFNI